MNSRDEILKRLRQSEQPHGEDLLFPLQDNAFFADYPRDSHELLDSFCHHFKDLSGEFHHLDNMEHTGKVLLGILKDIAPNLCRSHQSILIDNIKKVNPEIEKYLGYIDGVDINSIEFEKFSVGITGADYLIARTGSILVRTVSAGGRRLSVLPPVHIVIAREKQLVFSLDEALANLYNTEGSWSYATIITGPSRTSDIEKQLVLGAHGPKRLILLLIKN
jgi:L-lactate dehydrogenase complex protein LldG